jgi:hypothetical protein
MRSAVAWTALAVLVVSASAGGPGSWSEGQAQERTGALLDRYDFDEDPVQRWRLPNRLGEISGLALAPDGHLLTHDDERSRIYRIDPREGEILARYELGDGGLRADFEAIAALDDVRFLIASNGTVFRFRDGSDDGSVPYEARVTWLRERCEVEGLTTAGEQLLIACKETLLPGLREHAVVFGFDPARMEVDTVPRYVVPWDDIRAAGGPRRFNPSAIEYDRSTGHVLLLSGRQNAMLELDASGAILGVVRLDDDRHRQPEGLALSPDGRLYVADEGGGGRARLAVYVSDSP